MPTSSNHKIKRYPVNSKDTFINDKTSQIQDERQIYLFYFILTMKYIILSR